MELMKLSALEDTELVAVIVIDLYLSMSKKRGLNTCRFQPSLRRAPQHFGGLQKEAN